MKGWQSETKSWDDIKMLSEIRRTFRETTNLIKFKSTLKIEKGVLIYCSDVEQYFPNLEL